VDVLDVLDADAVRRWSRAALESMRSHQAEIDALNVFPVPDRDTGTNLLLTLLVADDAVQGSGLPTAGAALGELARAAVLGARGNSGVIVSQLFRGLADAVGTAEVLDAAAFCRGLRLGADLADEAVARPVEGTILTVAHAAADALPVAGTSLGDCVRTAVLAAEAALARTRDQLQALREAGVVDAGARGYVLLLEALAQVVSGSTSEVPQRLTQPARAAVPTTREAGSPEFAYEVQYLLDAAAEGVATLRAQLIELGDSVAVVGTGDGVWNVHVHVNDVGAALEAGLGAGRPHRVSVVRFDDQASDGTHSGDTIAVVAAALGEGLGHLFAREGVQVIASADPSAADVLAAVQATSAHEVVVLANGIAATTAAEVAARLARENGLRVAVVPTRSPMQALASVAVHDPMRRFDDDVVAMAEAAAATRFAEIAIALEQSLTSIGMCEAGDVLGLIDGEVVEIGHGLLAVVLALTDRLLGVGAELVTVVVGREAPVGVGDVIVAHIRGNAPLTDVVVYHGEQQVPPVIIGVE
jgi:DAK2 domain fusion protein YloV